MNVEGQRVFRSGVEWIVAAVWGLAAVVGLATASQANSGWVRAVAAVGGVAFGVLAIRAARAGVTLDNQGLVARADRFTRRLRWQEVERFDVRGRLGGGVWARTIAGEWVKLLDVGMAFREKGLRIAGELEAERRRHQSSGED